MLKNNNPGKFEMFYGEIEDLEEARKYVASLPYVDPNRIYLVGHSTGGTKAVLLSEYSKDLEQFLQWERQQNLCH